MSDPLNRQQPKGGSPTFYGGPKDGELVQIPGGLPASQIRPPGIDSGWYVWNDDTKRYEWRP